MTTVGDHEVSALGHAAAVFYGGQHRALHILTCTECQPDEPCSECPTTHCIVGARPIPTPRLAPER